MTVNPAKPAAQALIEAYQKVRAQSEAICAPLQTEDYVVQPALDASPPKWHLGHTTWFFENFVLKSLLPDYQLFDERLNFLFNSYYESQGPRILRSNRGNMSRPSVETVYAYRKHVDETLMEVLANTPLSGDMAHVITVGLHHEQQHQELLLTDIKYILGHNPLFPVYQDFEAVNAESLPLSYLSVDAGRYQIGFQEEGFCWDNELSAHEVYLESFDIGDRLITNSEYVEFMNAGGYDRYDLWLSEGWEWIKTLEEKAPKYWYQQAGEWYVYHLNGLKKVDPNAPVTHICYFEADAFARWKGQRLPTEFEWEAACRKYQPNTPDSGFMTQGTYLPAGKENNNPQFLGQCWEWTSSAYAPYPRYPQFKGALGEYNGKFMVNQMVLRGGSVATPQDHIRISYRNFFHTDKRWQFTGIRLVK
ncbi:MAG: ergothioneine biosynthesis protein EgtB [Bacteroidota bacterium]